MEWWQIQELMWTATGIFVVLIAVPGVTLRFAIKPFLRDLHELREARRGTQASRRGFRSRGWIGSRNTWSGSTGRWRGYWRCRSSTGN